MTQIINLHLEKLKEKYFIAFMMFVLEAIGKFEVLTQRFAYYVDQIRLAYNELNRVYLKYDADFCTEAVQEADRNRNTAFTRLRNAIRAHILLDESETKTQAADILLKIIELYGGTGIPTQGLTAKSASICNLVEDFEEKYPTEVETLGVGNLVVALKQAQAIFNDKYMRRAECDSEIGKGAMAEARKRMTKAYRDFVTIVNLEAQHDTEGVFTDFINLLNVEIGRNRTHTGQGQVNTTKPKPDGEGSETTPPTEGEQPSESETTEPTLITALFKFHSGQEEEVKAEAGAPLTAPQNTEGYRWRPAVPEVMPAENTTYTEVSSGSVDWGEGPGGDDPDL